jgi:pimeloyl-ACP methyl ester carboxylesterase
MLFFARDGIQFHFEERGKGIPFVFQHGLGADLSQPLGLFKAPSGFRLLAFDCRAHGQTHPAGPEKDINLGVFADDLIALLDTLKIERAVIGGISMGAAVAMRCVLNYPRRVLGLVLSRPAWLDAPNPYNVHMFTLVAGLLREYGAQEGQRRFQQTEDYRTTLARWPDVAKSLSSQFEHPNAEQTAYKFERIIKDAPCWDRACWRSIRIPTLILANREDPVHPFEYGEELARQIPGARFGELTSKSVSVPRHEADVQRHLEAFLLENIGSFQKQQSEA